MNSIDLDESLLSQWSGPAADGIDPVRTAVVVVDMQAGFAETAYPGCGPHVIDIVPNVNRIVQVFRNAGATIVYTRHTIVDEQPYAPPAWQMESPIYRPVWDSLRRTSPGHALYHGMDVAEGDLLIDKYRFSAFLPISSSIDADLRARGIETVVIVGTVTNICCESSARDAHMMGYDVIFVADATAATDDASHNATLANMALCFANVKTTDQTIEKIK